MISLKALLGNENNQNLKRRNRIEKARHICRAFLFLMFVPSASVINFKGQSVLICRSNGASIMRAIIVLFVYRHYTFCKNDK